MKSKYIILFFVSAGYLFASCRLCADPDVSLFRSVNSFYDFNEPPDNIKQNIIGLQSKSLDRKPMHSPWFEISCYKNESVDFGWSISLTEKDQKFILRVATIKSGSLLHEKDRILVKDTEINSADAIRLFWLVRSNIIKAIPEKGISKDDKAKYLLFSYSDSDYLLMTAWARDSDLNGSDLLKAINELLE